MLNPRLVLSGNLSGSNTALSLPGPISLTGAAYSPGAADYFDVSQCRGYSTQAFITGSSVNGTLTLQQSNNMQGWITISGAVVNGANINQDYLFSVPFNTVGFSRLLWSGSAGSGSFISVAVAGN